MTAAKHCERCKEESSVLHPITLPFGGQRLVCGPCLRSLNEWWEQAVAVGRSYG